MPRSGAEMADEGDRIVVGGAVEHEQGVVPEVQHEPKDAGEGTKAPAKLLVVLGEVHDVEQRDLALARVVAGLSSWDTEAAGCDVDEELNALVKLQPKGITDPTGETILEHKSELLEVKVFANPRLQTLQNQLHSFLVAGSRYRFLLYSGLTLHSTGCWFLQDGCFGFASLAEVFHRPAVQLETAKQQDAIVDVSVVAEAGEWTKAGITKLASQLRIRLIPPKVERTVDGIVSFSNYLSGFLKTPSYDDLLPSTKAIGSFGLVSATLHVFPAGQGDSALFGLSGFNLLFDGGYARRSCFWEMVRHLPTLDAVALSHLGPDNLFGIRSFLEKKVHAKDSPELGVVYLNETKTSPAPSDSSRSLLVNVADQGLILLDTLRQMETPVLHCTGYVHGQVLHPINVYHKVGHGSVDLYVLSPLSDAKEPKTIGGGPKGDHPSSSCFLLVWQPASASEKPTRILFPGNTPQAKIFEGLDRLKNVAVFQNALGVAEKVHGPAKGAEKSAAVGAKPTTVKAKPPSGTKLEQKDVKKPAPEQKATAEQHKEMVRKASDQKETKKPTVEPKEAKKPVSASTEAKNGKAAGLAKKEKESPVKATPAASKIAKKTEGDGGKDAKKTTAKQPHAPAAATTKATAADEGKLKVDIDEASALPAPSDADEPPTTEVAGVGELSQVQALPEPTTPEDQVAEAAGLQDDDGGRGTAESTAEEEEECPEEEFITDGCVTANNEDSTEAKAGGDGQNVEQPEELFDPSKDWGAPEGLPAPSNGKEPSAAAAKRAAHNVSVIGASAAGNAKKPDTSRNADTKAGTKRPTTAPERLNNTGREEDEKAAATNQSAAKGRPSVTSSHKDGASSVRAELKKQKPVVPFYVDVAYIPGHGSPHYFDVDFFRRVRACHYVLSSVNPHVKALALLLEGKQTWEDSNAEVSVIPTYDSEAMLSWIRENKDQLQKLKIKIGPPAYKCRMQLQEADTSCASYRLEF